MPNKVTTMISVGHKLGKAKCYWEKWQCSEQRKRLSGEQQRRQAMFSRPSNHPCDDDASIAAALAAYLNTSQRVRKPVRRFRSDVTTASAWHGSDVDTAQLDDGGAAVVQREKVSRNQKRRPSPAPRPCTGSSAKRPRDVTGDVQPQLTKGCRVEYKFEVEGRDTGFRWYPGTVESASTGRNSRDWLHVRFDDGITLAVKMAEGTEGVVWRKAVGAVAEGPPPARQFEEQESDAGDDSESSCASTSQDVGVRKSYSKWQAQIRRDGTVKCLGSFLEEKDAAHAYDAAVREKQPPKRLCNGQLKEVPRAFNFPKAQELQAIKIGTRQLEEESEDKQKTSVRYVGVSRCGSKWQARIRRNGKRIVLGAFSVKEDAARAYDAAVRETVPRRYHPRAVGDSREQMKEVPRAVNFPRSDELQLSSARTSRYVGVRKSYSN